MRPTGNEYALHFADENIATESGLKDADTQNIAFLAPLDRSATSPDLVFLLENGVYACAITEAT
jgi:hypothetical protein